MSVTTKMGLQYAGKDDVPDEIKEQQATAFEDSKKKANKERAKNELKLDDRDIDDTMNPDTQKKILDEIKQQKGGSNQQPQGGGLSSQDSKPHNDRVHQAIDQTAAQPNLNRHQNFASSGERSGYPSGSTQERNVNLCPPGASSILRAGEMEPPQSPSQPMQQHANADHRFHGSERRQPEHYFHNAAGTHYPQSTRAPDKQQQYPNPQMVNRQLVGVPAIYDQPHGSGNVHQMQPGQPPYPPYNRELQYGQPLQPYQGGGNAYMQAGDPNYLSQQPSGPYQPPYPNQPGNYHNRPPNSVLAQPVHHNPHNLEVGSLIQYNTYTGVIRWIDGYMAGVEMVIIVLSTLLFCV